MTAKEFKERRFRVRVGEEGLYDRLVLILDGIEELLKRTEPRSQEALQ